MKILTALTLITLALSFSGCTVLRYQFEPALNAVPKDATITGLTNDYVEYSKSGTNVVQSTNVITIHYRAYYGSDGQIYKTEIVEKR
jgi:hypothetical protein